jgi:3-hydroxypropanoate dehydrogenase
MSHAIPDQALDQLFRTARTFAAWKPEPVSNETLRQIYDLYKLGPTSMNCSPARVVFLTTDQAKARLLPALAPTNVEKSRTAPVVALIAYDTEFYEQLPKLFPFVEARNRFAGNQKLIDETAFRNGTLQGAYLLLAARAMGLDCGPMSGFDAAKVNAEFFPDGKWKVNFICNLGHGDAKNQHPRAPRLTFDEACRVL